MELTRLERTMLWNQYEILKKLAQAEDERNGKSNGEVEEYEYFQNILRKGYEAEYESILPLKEDILDLSSCNFVNDTLMMYNKILVSYNNLTEDQKNNINIENVIFKGFDGNEEVQYQNYAIFLIETADRFPHIKDSCSNVDWNTHRRRKNKYISMLKRWKEIDTDNRSELLSAEEISQIINR